MDFTKHSLSTNQNFEVEIKEHEIGNNSLVFVFIDSKLLLTDSKIPVYSGIQKIKLSIDYQKYIGKINNISCFALDINNDEEILSSDSLVSLYQLYSILPDPYLKAAIFSSQIILWNRKNKYCGTCGARTEERMSYVLVKCCPDCKEEYYPKISPSVIVAVVNNDKILLAQHKRLPKAMYTVLAGFVNPGESLEECIHREIKEEANIEVTNIRYFGSQSWPFPDSLMIGFIADYSKGELKPDKEEITDLKWFSACEIPEWADKFNISRALIDNFIENNL